VASSFPGHAPRAHWLALASRVVTAVGPIACVHRASFSWRQVAENGVYDLLVQGVLAHVGRVKDVWVIETAGYPEQSFFFGVATSLEKAIAYLKEAWGAPYRVEWWELEEYDDCFEIEARHFYVRDHSCAHRERYRITKYDLH